MNNTKQTMTVLTGKNFKAQYGDKFYKFVKKDMTHNNFKYQLGLNTDTIPFNPTGECRAGGLYFSNKENISLYYSYGPLLATISISDDAQIYIKENKFKADKLIIDKLIDDENEIIEVLKLASAICYSWDKQTCRNAAENGHLEILKWARKNGYSWDEWTCAEAAKNGHFEVLKWARENGCPWDEMICAFAAKNGDLEVLKWARANGCPWGADTCANAAWKGRLEVLKWARAKPM